MEEFILSQQGFDLEDLMKYGFYIVIFFGAVLLRGAKAIIDAINKKKQPGGEAGSAMPTQGAAPTAQGRPSSPTAPVARPLPPQIRRSEQAPAARPLPRRPAAPSQAPAPPMQWPDELVIPELATPQGSVPTRPPEAPARRPDHPAPARPLRTKSSKAKPETRKRRTTEERLGRLDSFLHDKHLDPESHLDLKKKTADRADDGRKLGSMTSRAALRQAIVMNEILGPPIALRQQDEPAPWGS